MKLDSKYFDCLRTQSNDAGMVATDAPTCQWKGCLSPGAHRAPRGRGHEGEFYLLCLDHVRQFNASYNYFEGMSNADIEAYQKDSVIGHRPTWKVGANAWAHGTRHNASNADIGGRTTNDPHAFFTWRSGRTSEAEARRPLKPLEAKALESLDLGASASKEEIKSRFKELVKRHHPDANGGDTRSEDKLREIIQAYNYLKQAGLA
jgi:DnaJ domain